MRQPFTVGQHVRITAPLTGALGEGEFVVLRRYELDSDDPNYVIENAVDHRLRREPHSRLTAAGGE